MISFSDGVLVFSLGSYLISVDVVLMVVAITVAAFDLALKWLAYRRIESVAIHISSFMLVFSLVASLTDPWYSTWKVFSSLGILVSLIIAHTALREMLEDQIDARFEELATGTAPPDHRILQLAKRVSRYVVAVALSRERPGKLRRRKELVQFLQATGVDAQSSLHAEVTDAVPSESFMIPKDRRRWAPWLFSFLAVASILVVVVDVSLPLGPATSCHLKAQVQAHPATDTSGGSLGMGGVISVDLPGQHHGVFLSDGRTIVATHESLLRIQSELTVTLSPNHTDIAHFSGSWTDPQSAANMRIEGESIPLSRKEGSILVYRVRGSDTCQHLSNLSSSIVDADGKATWQNVPLQCAREAFIEIRVEFQE